MRTNETIAEKQRSAVIWGMGKEGTNSVKEKECGGGDYTREPQGERRDQGGKKSGGDECVGLTEIGEVGVQYRWMAEEVRRGREE